MDIQHVHLINIFELSVKNHSKTNDQFIFCSKEYVIYTKLCWLTV